MCGIVLLFVHIKYRCGHVRNGLEEQIESFKKEHSDLKIVVVDVMQMVRSNVESSYGIDYAELIGLKQLAYRFGTPPHDPLFTVNVPCATSERRSASLLLKIICKAFVMEQK